VRIRRFTPEDTESVVALWEAAGLTRPWNDPRRDIARKLTVQPELFLVGTAADDTATPIATVMAGFDGHRGWINYLAVHPDHRRRGHAAALMAEVERQLEAAGCPKANLQVRTDNAEAFAFYSALGYTQDAAVSLGKRLIAD
jgi:ribosomal protein S18 acetylase RimI-like enzyme